MLLQLLALTNLLYSEVLSLDASGHSVRRCTTSEKINRKVTMEISLYQLILHGLTKNYDNRMRPSLGCKETCIKECLKSEFITLKNITIEHQVEYLNDTIWCEIISNFRVGGDLRNNLKSSSGDVNGSDECCVERPDINLDNVDLLARKWKMEEKLDTTRLENAVIEVLKIMDDSSEHGNNSALEKSLGNLDIYGEMVSLSRNTTDCLGRISYLACILNRT